MKDEIVLYKPNEQFQLEVQLKDETVWLNVNQIALLFDRDRTVISRHIRNIYKEGELDENITCAKFAHMGMDADHVTAWSKNGATDISNCQMLCQTHNRAKGNK